MSTRGDGPRLAQQPDSLRDLAAQPGMAEAEWGKTRLENAIKLSLMSKAPNDLRAWRFLRVSHYEVAFGLPADQHRALLDQADLQLPTDGRR